MKKLNAVILIPMSLTQWELLHYRNIPHHEVANIGESIQIQVKKSAAPLVHLLPKPLMIKSLSTRVKLEGSINYPHEILPGEKGADDFPFRLGLVIAGDKKLNFAKRLIAPDWIKKLYEMAPKDQGISHIHFLTLTTEKKPTWQERQHPMADEINEEIVGSFGTGAVEIKKTFNEPLQVLGFWVGADGDDTASEFVVTMENLQITTND